MAEQPNEASKKSKAEGDRWDEAQEKSGISNRSDERAVGPLDTPRRYDQPIEEDDDPVMPGDDATLNTKI
jgi:hypothetical protein